MSKLIRNSKNKNKSLPYESASLIIGALFRKVGDDTIQLGILGQDENLRDGISGKMLHKIRGKLNFTIRSDAYPDFVSGFENVLYIRGRSRLQDYGTFIMKKVEFDTIFLPGLNSWKKVRLVKNKKEVERYIAAYCSDRKVNYQFEMLLVM